MRNVMGSAENVRQSAGYFVENVINHRRKGRIETMNTCETCGNKYDKCFEIISNGESHVFDSFECAIQALAPTCGHCRCRIIGHGLEADGVIYCCDYCAESSGVKGLRDRV